VGRRDVARKAVADNPPEARPTPDNCRYCGVRQLCEDYWTEETQHALAKALGASDSPFRDFELTISGRHGPSSWDARVEVSRDVPTGRRVVVRVAQGALPVQWGKGFASLTRW
jgi:hypothetical protein